jgi:Flp pilus assembly protein TadD
MRRLPLSVTSVLLATLLSTTAPSARASDASDSANRQTIDLKSLPTNLDDEIHHAQSFRTDGKFDDARHTLAQLMLVAPDDARVVGEYGKVLAQQGEGEDATKFLERAIEINPNEWSYFSALGVAFDETGKTKDAALAYQHALMLKPGDASVMNNLALSRMLSGDLPGAKDMIMRAQAASDGDEKIGRNVALVESRLPQVMPVVAAPAAPVSRASAPVFTPKTAAVVPSPTSVQSAPKATAVIDKAHVQTAMVETRAPVAKEAGIPVTRALSSPRPLGKDVVMENVPSDPLAGPVAPKKVIKVAAHHVVKHVVPADPAADETITKHSKPPALRMSADAS